MLFTVPIRRNRDFKRLYARGTSAASKNLVVYCRRVNSDRNRLGITVGGKIGKAVVRNLVRRRIKEAYRINEGKYARGNDIVIVARAHAVEASFGNIETELDFLFGRLRLLAKKAPVKPDKT